MKTLFRRQLLLFSRKRDLRPCVLIKSVGKALRRNFPPVQAIRTSDSNWKIGCPLEGRAKGSKRTFLWWGSSGLDMEEKRQYNNGMWKERKWEIGTQWSLIIEWWARHKSYKSVFRDPLPVYHHVCACEKPRALWPAVWSLQTRNCVINFYFSRLQSSWKIYPWPITHDFKNCNETSYPIIFRSPVFCNF